jgi:hypothetical protein
MRRGERDEKEPGNQTSPATMRRGERDEKEPGD